MKLLIFHYLCGMNAAIELLAPARDYEAAVAAIEAGADALYMGGARFGARVAASNSVEEVARVVRYAHRFGVRVYCTLNTLLFDSELADAEKQARELISAGVDALIVQDMAFRRMNLPVELHASTQTNNVDPEGVKFLADCGFARVILERGLSLEQIRSIRRSTDVELESFVHGAICVGSSGRCFLSRSMTADRSGNRGACSQPCRLSYDLLDERNRKLISGKHLLSVRDMNLTERLGELMDAGVSSFKIEGRLKDVTYIRNVVAWYRCAIDRELALRPHLHRASVGLSQPDFQPDPAKSFTRGFTEYMYSGPAADVASFDTPKAVGEFVGHVVRCDGRSLLLDCDHTLAAGDGICFAGRGTNINRVEGRSVEPNRTEGFEQGMAIYRNFDLRFTQQLQRSRMRRLIPTTARVEASAEVLTLTYTDCEGVQVSLTRKGPFEQAQNPEKMASTLRSQLAKSGDTIFSVTEVELLGPMPFLPASVVAELRREALARLEQLRSDRPFEHRIQSENLSPRFPRRHLTAEENVTNRLAEAFYRDHGVEQIAPALELEASTVGHRVLHSPYCIRREIGQCLKKNPTLRGELFLEHGMFRYRLVFDCARCQMSLIHEDRK